ncbi:partner and localizer of BRCA2 [Triplophysa dalaica]|uniref:partner and localizer of BRCA2 n=1 Tax=Triplophysa dalaica TaxID=1582913 RepID=UPI0024DF7A26|nr:partner and localizer of BRCA2 [Triplophysa dalaica]XP_056619458.1 partner and localizer of BRCA2 [Triplophysa dalaica]
MEEDNDDKETLRRRLEVLKQEYEMTARRLQKAEHRDAVRRQGSVSHQNRFTLNESSLFCTSSSVLASELSDNQDAEQLRTIDKRSSLFSTVEKIPAIQFQLAEIASTSPASMRSPTHRLRSKRSRLRLQNKERESDTDYSQEKESLIQGKQSGCMEEKAKLKKERDIEILPCKVEKNKELPKKGKKDDTIAKETRKLQRSEKTEVNCADKTLVSSDENNMAFHTLNICQKQLPPLGSSKELQSRTAAYLDPIQTSSLPPSSESVHTDKSYGMLPSDSNKNINSSVMSGALDSCTLVEGLTFPVEYYIRTTRRMAASQSSVNLEAVILSQLTGGRGRRKPSQSEMRGRGHVSSERPESVRRSTNQTGGRGKGQRRRGRRRTTIVRSPCSKAASDCTISLPASDSQLESPFGIDLKSTPQSTAQSELEERPQGDSQPIQLSVPTANLNPSKEDDFTKDFKHLPDSQLYFESKLLTDSNLYPIFRRGRGLQIGEYSSQPQTCMSKDDHSPLPPSLSSLIQGLPDTKIGLLASVDIQDFHLPDEDFGQLKLEKLRMSSSLVEPFVHRVYNTRRSNRYQTAWGRKDNGGELFTPEPPTSFTLEDSLPLCQSDPVEQSQIEIQNTDQSEKHADHVNKPNSRSSDRIDSGEEQTSTIIKTEKTANDEHTVKTQTSGNENVLKVDPEVELQMHKQTDSQTLSENSRLCPALLDFSPLLTSHTQRGQDHSLPSLGLTPHFLSQGSPTDLQRLLFSPADSRRSPSSNMPTGCVSPDFVSRKTCGNVKANTSMKSSDPTKVEGDTETQNQTEVRHEIIMGAQNNANHSATGYENSIVPETEMKALCIMEREQKCSFDAENNPECKSKINCTSEIEVQPHNLSESAAQHTDRKHTDLKTETHKGMVMNQSQCVDASGCAGHDEAISFDTSTNQQTEEKMVCTTNADEAKEHGSDFIHLSPVPTIILPKAGHCSSLLREMHTFKALEGGCVLDLCFVRWTAEDLCICVAGEWSVCLWTQKKGVQLWSLIHTWTFAQSVMSLQAIPDSSGLLCVTLGDLEITEARVLCCPSMDGPFTQNVVCQDALQALEGVSDCRLVCCSTPGEQQKVTVITLSKEGRVVKTLSLVPAKQNIRTLATIEGEKDALIGWTECKTLLIWSMKSGHLLQTIYLEKTLPMTNCMRGYSYRGVLCLLLQNTGNVCEEKSNTTLFALIATNPLTGKHITLTSISSPAQHIQQLIDGDVFGSGLVGVFQSGHIAVWDLRGRVAKVIGVLDELCRLARWAGPDTLLTGYLNGDVSVFQYNTV